MQEKRFTNSVGFYMDTDDFNALKNYFRDDGRKITTFLRVAIRKELDSGEIGYDDNQIWRLGKCINCKKNFTFKMNNVDLDALRNYLKNTELSISTFCRYLLIRELHRLKTYNKEKNQTWDIE